MKLSELIEVLERDFPQNLAEGWDNPGLQVGRTDNTVNRVMLALDATGDVIRQAKEQQAQLILTHHPLLFSSVKKITDSDFIGGRILTLAENGIACFAMHTNFDVAAMADAAADRMNLSDRSVLMPTGEFREAPAGIGKTGLLPKEMTLSECARYTAEVFRIPNVRFYGDPERIIRKCSILPGSGGGEIDYAAAAGSDVMITGDINHHTGLDAVEKGIAVIDAGHYGIEKLFIPYMEEYLRTNIPELKVCAAENIEPFHETAL